MKRWPNVISCPGLLIASVLFCMPASAASTIKVAATIAPLHSLVAMVTDGIVEPALIVRPGASPHGYALKPSEAHALNEADVLFWIGEALEPWMAKAVTTLAAGSSVIELAEIDGVHHLEARKGGLWSTHEGEEAGHDHGHGHDHEGGHDPHLWLAPDNAKTWLPPIAEALASADPDHAEAYRANAAAAVERIATIAAEIESLLEPVKHKPYVVFHDAYQYFERHFGLRPLGAISLGDADRPGPARLLEVREAIASTDAVCIFAEPQFAPKLIETVSEGVEVEAGTLDPIGAGLQPGPELYPTLMLGLAESLRDCLG